MTPPVEPWVDGRLAVGPSGIEGRGLFARAPVAAGQVIFRLGGVLVDTAELARLIAGADAGDRPYVDTITVFEDRHLVLPPGTAVHYGNHSCDPNAWFAGAYEIAARRPIATGEEVTTDYATSSGVPEWTMACRCGSVGCRGRITGWDWRVPELQERYGDRWTPALLQRIRKLAGPDES
ncbi:MAG TPA: SET domain-containing protein-lysine N-methyltransferase [Acidimicrobiales bacterium]|nr:SET domain-containing protein-lysine N-methyltransferase [Acidimicrobiales bacterium]